MLHMHQRGPPEPPPAGRLHRAAYHHSKPVNNRDQFGSWTPLYDVDDIGTSGVDTVGEQCIARGRVQFLNQIVMIVFVNEAHEYRS
jgi:hypothetical protein